MSSVRNTKQREVILDELRKTTSHPTADAIYSMVRKRLPKVSLGTIYRNLEWLTQRGEVRKLSSPDAQKRYDGNAHPHHHIQCSECGRIDDLFGIAAPSLRKRAELESGYKVNSFHIEFTGVCSACKRNSKKNKEN